LDFLRGSGLGKDSEDRGNSLSLEVDFLGSIEMSGNLSEELGFRVGL